MQLCIFICKYQNTFFHSFDYIPRRGTANSVFIFLKNCQTLSQSGRGTSKWLQHLKAFCSIFLGGGLVLLFCRGARGTWPQKVEDLTFPIYWDPPMSIRWTYYYCYHFVDEKTEPLRVTASWGSSVCVLSAWSVFCPGKSHSPHLARGGGGNGTLELPSLALLCTHSPGAGSFL